MKAVLMSIQPKWCELIANGKKMIEVRKTKPKLETPFKVYIYATKSGNRLVLKNDKVYEISKNITGKVIGEFVCETIDNLVQYGIGVAVTDKDNNLKKANVIREKSCLTDTQICEYLNEKDGYAWHISNLVIYDEPKELYEFKTLCTDFYDGKHCEECDYFIDGRGYEYDESDCGCDGLKPLKRPPQSWCYVESEVDTE